MISSKTNPRIKNVVKLQKASERSEQELFTVEGFREIDRAIRSGFRPEELYICETISKHGQQDAILNQLPAFKNYETVTEEVFEKMAYREGSDGIIAVFKSKSNSLKDLKLPENPLLIVLEAVEKPGNLGAVMRTADAAGVDAIIICNPTTDLYNPNTIRASLGCIFSLNIIVSTSDEAIRWMKEKGIHIYCTYLEASVNYLAADYTKPCAIVMGSEAEGLTQKWIQGSDKNIIIPMHGIADSLNVSVSSAVVVYEALRQRDL
ncbi:MAG: TrmH family RNA methyltransferase [Bacteroidales bacterium]